MSRAIRVVKLGGSLFDLESLPARLAHWLEGQPSAMHVLVVGGGPLADFVRQADQRYAIGACLGHDLCVSLMNVTARLMAEILPGARLVDDYSALSLAVHGTDELIVFAAESYLRDHEPVQTGPQLSRDWRTTSDAIAGRLAVSLDANELVLLKSAPLPAGISRTAAAQQGLIDERFPLVTDGLAVRWVNLRARAPTESKL